MFKPLHSDLRQANPDMATNKKNLVNVDFIIWEVLSRGESFVVDERRPAAALFKK